VVFVDLGDGEVSQVRLDVADPVVSLIADADDRSERLALVEPVGKVVAHLLRRADGLGGVVHEPTGAELGDELGHQPEGRGAVLRLEIHELAPLDAVDLDPHAGEVAGRLEHERAGALAGHRYAAAFRSAAYFSSAATKNAREGT
jgi:hypothetical protein